MPNDALKALSARRQRPRTPVLDRSHPLARGLVWSTFLGAGGGTELVSGGKPTPFGATVQLESATEIGPAALNTGGSSGIYYPTSDQLCSLTGKVTVVAWARHDSLSGDASYAPLFSYPVQSAWAGPYGFCFRKYSTSARGEFMLPDGSGGSNYHETINPIGTTFYVADSKVHQYAGTWDSSVTGTACAQFFRDGQFVANGNLSSISNALYLPTGYNPTLFNRSNLSVGTTGDCLLGALVGVAIWNRVLSADELAELHYNPYAFLKTDSIDLIRITPSSGTNYTQTETDAEGITDSITQQAAFLRTQTDPLGISDALSQIVAGARTVTDTEGITDSVSQVSAAARSQTDSEGITDSVAQAVAGSRSATEAVGVSDSVSLLLGKTQTDAEGVTDSLTQTVAGSRSATDAEGITDSVAVDLGRPVTDQVGFTDSAAQVSAAARTPTDAEGITDSVSYTLSSSGAQTQNDNEGITDSTSQATGYVRKVLSQTGTHAYDPVGITDSVSYVLSGAATDTQTDAVGITDAAVQQVTGGRTATDAIGTTDQTAQTLSAARPVVDAAGISDEATQALTAGRTDTDQVGVTDAAQQVLDAVRNIVDSAGLTDSVSYVHVRGAATVAAVSTPSVTPVAVSAATATAVGNAPSVTPNASVPTATEAAVSTPNVVPVAVNQGSAQ